MFWSATKKRISSQSISSESSVGAAIIGRKKGEIVDVRAPAGILRYKILKISKPN